MLLGQFSLNIIPVKLIAITNSINNDNSYYKDNKDKNKKVEQKLKFYIIIIWYIVKS